MKPENNRGTLQSNVVCAYSEPDESLLTVSAAPFIPNDKHASYLKLSMPILFLAILAIPTFAAQDFIIENRTSALFVVNGTTGIMAFSFGMVDALAARMLNLTGFGGQSYGS